MRDIRKARLLGGAALLWLALPAGAAPFSNLYFFGDSLTDSGNIYDLTVGLYPPAPYDSGRFSNGPVWAETFAELKGFPAAGQHAGMTLGPNFLYFSKSGPGNNYAIGGAHTGFGGALDSYGIPSGIAMQTFFYLSRVNNTADPNALYVLFGGANDIRDAALLPSAERQARAVESATYLAYSMYNLGVAGARRFLVMNLPDIGATPESRLVRRNAADATEATLVFNWALNYWMDQITFPGLELFRLDTFALFAMVYQDALNGGAQTGITNATLPCFAGYAGSPGLDCSTSLFADDIHPTFAAHTLLAQSASAAAQNPEPATLLSVLSGLAVLGVYLRRRARQAR